MEMAFGISKLVCFKGFWLNGSLFAKIYKQNLLYLIRLKSEISSKPFMDGG